MKKPVRIVLIVLAVLLCAGAVVLNVPRRYSARFDALEIDLDDPDYLRHAEIAADGTVSLNLFAQSYFTGAVTVEGYPETFDAAQGRRSLFRRNLRRLAINCAACRTSPERGNMPPTRWGRSTGKTVRRAP